MAKALRIGGFVSGAILIVFGVVVIALAINARLTVTDNLSDEKIVGSADMNPSDIEAAMKEAGLTGVDAPSCDVADEEIDTGSEARCFAEYMRIHALEASGGLTYAEMGRFATEDGDAKGTNDPAQAAKDDKGQPVSNSARKSLGDRDRAFDCAQCQRHGRAVVAVQPCRRHRSASRRCRLHRPRIRGPASTATRSGHLNDCRMSGISPLASPSPSVVVLVGGAARPRR